MELKSSVECDLRAFATLNPDGSLTVKLTAHAAYAEGMSTSAEIGTDELPEELRKPVADALTAVLAAQKVRLANRLSAALHDSRRVGRQFKELNADSQPVKPVKPAEVTNA